MSVYATEDGVHVHGPTEKEGDHVLGVHVLGPTEKEGDHVLGVHVPGSSENEGDHSIPQVAYKWQLFSWIGMNMHAICSAILVAACMQTSGHVLKKKCTYLISRRCC